jgi:glucokinase
MKYAIGIDIGATKIRGVLADSGGKMPVRFEIPTRAKRKKPAILGDIVKLIDCLKGETELRRFKLEGVGIGFPGIIKKGKLVFGGGTLKQLIGVNFKNLIQKESGLKVFLENDAVCFALAESFFGAGKNYNRVAGVIWGTGIGSGIIDKKNRRRASVEIGHFVVEPNVKNESKCGCGIRGCVENLASGKNIIRRYYAKGGKISANDESASGGKNAGVKEIYRSKERVAKEVLEEAYKYLGMAIAILVSATKPGLVVIGGGVSNLPEPAHRKLKKYVRQHISRKIKIPKITKSKLGNFSGALGAAILALSA